MDAHKLVGSGLTLCILLPGGNFTLLPGINIVCRRRHPGIEQQALATEPFNQHAHMPKHK